MISELVKHLCSDSATARGGLYIGPFSGANVDAAIKVASRMRPGQRVATILCETGERYQV